MNFALLLRLQFTRSNFLVSGVHKLVCVHRDQIQQFLACIFALLQRENFVDTFRMYPCNLFTSGSLHEIFWQMSSIDIVPEASSIFQDLIICNGDFGFWASNLFNCVHLIILFELLSKSLQTRCNQFWRLRVQQRSQDSSNLYPKMSFPCSSQ